MGSPQLSSPANFEQIVSKFGYNQVLKKRNRIDTSGQGGWDSDLKDVDIKFSYKSLDGELEVAFKNVEYVLNSMVSSWKDVYSVNSYHVNLAETREQVLYTMHRLFLKYIGTRGPIWEMNADIIATAFTEQ
ncbi:hypothetical protein BDF21DRAFT_468965 [Thamnidium elegans]|uniref:Uncharacterized protein n=1 Tax=Thamnidium elegans TaxID=101142 RepID=A0A8H7VQ52_9FUNG|nr:hypothetical protein INT48_001510 [Thamnidium elegans]KAI8049316.1 hypothetical protein BDF21DRAFT_468965 [Thamnidium elegans]